MICPYCGKSSPEEAKFCQSCGGKLPETPMIEDEEHTSSVDSANDSVPSSPLLATISAEGSDEGSHDIAAKEKVDKKPKIPRGLGAVIIVALMAIVALSMSSLTGALGGVKDIPADGQPETSDVRKGGESKKKESDESKKASSEGKEGSSEEDGKEEGADDWEMDGGVVTIPVKGSVTASEPESWVDTYSRTHLGFTVTNESDVPVRAVFLMVTADTQEEDKYGEVQDVNVPIKVDPIRGMMGSEHLPFTGDTFPTGGLYGYIAPGESVDIDSVAKPVPTDCEIKECKNFEIEVIGVDPASTVTSDGDPELYDIDCFDVELSWDDDIPIEKRYITKAALKGNAVNNTGRYLKKCVLYILVVDENGDPYGTFDVANSATVADVRLIKIEQLNVRPGGVMEIYCRFREELPPGLTAEFVGVKGVADEEKEAQVKAEQEAKNSEKE